MTNSIDDPDNPEWTAGDFKRAKPSEELPETFRRGFPRTRGPQRLPVKRQVTLRLDQDVLDRFKAEGPGWQSRINDALRRSLR